MGCRGQLRQHAQEGRPRGWWQAVGALTTPPYPPERPTPVNILLLPAEPTPRQFTTGVGCKEKAPGLPGPVGDCFEWCGARGNPTPTNLPGQLQSSNAQGGLG
jgi:hypothetical protein